MSKYTSVLLESASSQYASIANGSQTGLSITGDITLEARVKLNSSPTSGNLYGIISKFGASSNKSYELQYRNNSGTYEIRFFIFEFPSTSSYIFTTTLPEDKWKMLSLTWDAATSTAKLYINGVQTGGDQTASATSITVSTADVYIGSQNAGANTFDGLINEARIWNTERSASEVQANYNQVLSGTESGLQALYIFDGDYTDETSNANNLTASNSPTFEQDSPYTQQALSLDLESSSSQYASIADGSQTGLDLNSDFSVEFWVKLESNTSCTFISKIDANGGYRVETAGGDANDLKMIYRQASGQTTEAYADEILTSSDLNKWVHIAITVDVSDTSAGIVFYKNGSTQSTTYNSTGATSVVGSTDSFWLGTPSGSSEFLDAKIRDLRVWNDIRTSTEIADNMQIANLDYDANLVARWLLDGDYTDETQNANNLTASNSPVFVPEVPLYTDNFSGEAKITIDNTQVSGSSNLTDFPALFADGNFIADVYTNAKQFTDQCLDLESSSSQYGTISDASQTGLMLTGNFTIEANIKLESLASTLGYSCSILGKDVSASTGYTLRINSGDNKLDFVKNDTTSYKANTVFETGKWYHVAVVFNGSNLLIYINGIQELSTAYTSHTSNTAAFYLGTTAAHTTRYFDGKIKDVRIWNIARTHKQLVSNMNTELAGNETGLDAYWKLDGNMLDETSNSNDLTASGSPTYPTDSPRGGADIRFTTDQAGTTEIPCEIVSWDGAGTTSEVHVKIPTVLYNTDTDIFVWYGNNGATFRPVDDAYGQYAVWSDYVGVWHFEDERDATENALTLTNTGSVPFSAYVIGKGADFTPNDSLNNNSAGLSTYPRSFSTIVNWDALTSDQAVIAQSDGSIHYYVLRLRDSDDHIIVRSNNNTQAADVDTGITAVAGQNYKIRITQHSTTSISIYVDGVKTNTTATTFVATVSQLYFGSLGRSPFWYLDGQMDETRMINSAPSDDFEVTEYNNQNAPGTFATGSDLVTTVTTTIQAKSRITQLGVSQYIVGKARVAQNDIVQTVQAKSRLKSNGNVQSIAAKGKVNKGNTQTIDAKASVKNTLENDVSAKGRVAVRDQSDQIQAKARLKKTSGSMVEAKGSIKHAGVARTIQSKARVMKNDLRKTIQAKAALKIVGLSYTIQAKARVNRTYVSTCSAKARIRAQRRGVIGIPSTTQSYPKTMDDARFLN